MTTERKTTLEKATDRAELVRLDAVSMDEDDEILPDFEAEVDGRRVWVTAVLERTAVIEPAPGEPRCSSTAGDSSSIRGTCVSVTWPARRQPGVAARPPDSFACRSRTRPPRGGSAAPAAA